MIRTGSRAVIALVLGSWVLATVGGCGGENRQPQPKAEAHLQALAVFYGRYIQQNRGRPPKDEKAFKEFLAKLGPNDFATFGVANAEEVLTSPRDNQPYVVRYNQGTAIPGPQGPPVIAYEQTGESGRRYVAFSLGGVEEVDAARFAQLVPDAPPSP